MTVDEIRDLVRLVTTVDSGEVTDAQLLDFINEGILDVAMRDEWPWLEGNASFSTVASTREYALSALTAYPQEITFVIRSGDTEPLLPISYMQAVAQYGDDFPSGTPRYWFLREEKISLVPVPSAVETIKVFYTIAPTELTTGSDTPAWIATFHHLLVDWVESKVWKQQEDYEKSEIAFGRYLDRVDLMKRAYESRMNTGPWAVGSGRNVLTGRSEPFRNDWGVADVS